jgi:hypothetical protein
MMRLIPWPFSLDAEGFTPEQVAAFNADFQDQLEAAEIDPASDEFDAFVEAFRLRTAPSLQLVDLGRDA